MTDNNADAATAEFAAIQTVHSALSPLDTEARTRVLGYISSLFGIAAPAPAKTPATPKENGSDPDGEDVGGQELDTGPAKTKSFATFAELFDAANPTTNANKALVAGYWLQVCLNADSFDGHSANKELKNLGYGAPNITTAINTLKGQKPALALQLQKSGKSQQARKVYKVTEAGIKAVKAMIDG